tara:strand:- start:796 stop:2946 length:2151 start_codon:yes stop_codon:yes gene_type:complete
VEDAKHARLGVVTGTTPSQLAHERFPDADIMEFGAFTDVLGALSAGHIDATITGINGAILAARNNDELAVIEGSLRDESTSVAVQKGNDHLLAAVNRLINEMKADGTLADLDRRWLKREPGPYETKDIPLPAEGEALRVGVSASSEPVAFVDKRRGLTGRDVEIAHEIASRLGRPLEFFDVRWDGLIPALQSGRIDLIISGMTGNAERAQYVDFSESYYQNKLVLLVRKSASSEALPYQDLEFEDLKSAPIAVVVGTVHDSYAQKNFPDAELLQFNTFADQLLAVEQRRVASALSDEDPIKAAIDEGHPLKTLGPSIFVAEYGAGFNKDSSALRDQFNEFLAELVASGDYDGIVDRWVTTGTGPMPDIQFSGDEPPLNIGNSVYGLPSVAVQNGELVGFDIEIAVRFAQYIGKRPVWATSDWGALIPSLVSGKIDLVVSSMTITEERAERINFSDSYYSTGNYFVVLDDTKVVGNAVSGAESGGTFVDHLKDSFYSNIIKEDRYLLLWDGLKITILLSLLSGIFGTAVGGVVCFMRMSSFALLNVPAKIFISILRGTPVLVLLMIIFYVIFAKSNISPVLVAIIAFGLNFGAYASEIFRSGIQSIDRGQTEAGISMGFSKARTFIYVIMPQTIQRILPVYKGEFISMIKMTSIVGYVAVQDLTKASDIIRARTFDAFFPLLMIAILYFLIAWLFLKILDYVEDQTDPLRRREVGRS